MWQRLLAEARETLRIHRPLVLIAVGVIDGAWITEEVLLADKISLRLAGPKL